MPWMNPKNFAMFFFGLDKMWSVKKRLHYKNTIVSCIKYELLGSWFFWQNSSLNALWLDEVESLSIFVPFIWNMWKGDKNPSNTNTKINWFQFEMKTHDTKSKQGLILHLYFIRRWNTIKQFSQTNVGSFCFV